MVLAECERFQFNQSNLCFVPRLSSTCREPCLRPLWISCAPDKDPVCASCEVQLMSVSCNYDLTSVLTLHRRPAGLEQRPVGHGRLRRHR